MSNKYPPGTIIEWRECSRGHGKYIAVLSTNSPETWCPVCEDESHRRRQATYRDKKKGDGIHL